MVNKLKYPVIKVDLGKPTQGYWDGGPKQHFTFSPTPRPEFKVGDIEWGSWGANYYFTSKSGRSWAEAASIAKRHIKKILRVKSAKVEIEWETED